MLALKYSSSTLKTNHGFNSKNKSWRKLLFHQLIFLSRYSSGYISGVLEFCWIMDHALLSVTVIAGVKLSTIFGVLILFHDHFSLE